MQAGVCLRQDTETTLPELTEQHRIRQKEEELSGLESVHMAESETECAAPGLNTLEPECVTAHSGVSDVHHTHTSLMKTETDLGSTHSGDLIKMESLDSTELGYVTHLHPDQIKTETDDDEYLRSEQISDWPDIKCVLITCDQVKCESSENIRTDLMNPEMSGVGLEHKDPIDPRLSAVHLNVNCEEEIHDLSTQNGSLNLCWCENHEKNGNRIIQENSKSINKAITCEMRRTTMEPIIIASTKTPSIVNCPQKKTFLINEGENLMVQRSFKCAQCERCFSSKSGLSNHLRIHTGQTHTAEKPYRCTQCEKCFSWQSDFDKHLKVHSGEKPHRCSHCGKCFSRSSDVRRHQLVHTAERPCKCTHCEKSFRSRFSLKNHLKIHSGEKPFKCSDCGKCFSQSSHLKDHQRSHTDEFPYRCTQCEKYFSRKNHLDKHLRMHTGEKPYKCTQCEKCFNQLPHLKCHLMTHTGEKPYQCTQCEMGFSRKKYLDKHLRMHTGEKPYKCTQCGECFNQLPHLKCHLMSHTGEKALEVYAV
ncbi:hypothetical protein GJAV_G00120150 [Gymnothorax javanicus]|nr:hypothetical protein GJAV_G00120150 [Gymnothorax javanicus]